MNKNYIIYIIKYMGVALIAGSVVHVGTLQNGFTRYVLLGILGLFLMILGNVLEAKNLGHKINLQYLLVITGLSVATGFLSGGIQHYLDNPVYAGYLLSFGLFISYVTFFWKEKISLNYKNAVMVLLVSILIFAFSYYIIAPKILQSTETTITPEHGH
jgi:predicted PurR-regulated permease PerM